MVEEEIGGKRWVDGGHLGVQKLGCLEGCHEIRLGQAMGLECQAGGGGVWVRPRQGWSWKGHPAPPGLIWPGQGCGQPAPPPL